jgi:opacity protein-like surface antigen
MRRLAGAVGGLVLVAALTLPASAQTVVLGGGLVHGADMEPFDLGAQAGLYVGLNRLLPGLRLGGDVEYYFRDSEEVVVVFPDQATGFSEEITTTTLESSFVAINLNAQYLFLRGAGLDLYGLAGLSMGRASTEVLGTSQSETRTDLNLGGGLELPLTFLRLYAEAKLVVGEVDRLVAGAGLRLGF